MKKNILLALIITLSVFPAVSKAQIAITAVPFLQIEPDSRGAAMGNTGVAIADNAAALFWNPAGLAFQSGNQVSFTHTNWLRNFNVSDLFYDYLVGKFEVEGLGTFGGHITFLNLGEQENRDGQNVLLSRFNSYEFAVGVSYGYPVNDNLALGTSLRVIYSSLASGIEVDAQKVNPGSSIAVDIATLYRTNPFRIGANNARFSFGLNLSNIGPSMQYIDNSQKDPLPMLLRFGYAIDYDLDPEGFNRITLATDVSKIMARTKDEAPGDTTNTNRIASGPIEALFNSWGSWTHFNGQENVSVSLLQQFMIGSGIEYWYDNTFALRGGFYYEDPNNGDRKYITFGAGIRYNAVGVDFSYIKTLESDHPLANTLRFSLLVDF